MTNIRQETRCELERRELLALCETGPQILACETGELWITFDGRREDVILRAGEQLALDDGRGVVISALQPANFVLTPHHPTGIRLLSAGESIWAATRRVRWHFPALASLSSNQLR